MYQGRRKLYRGGEVVTDLFGMIQLNQHPRKSSKSLIIEIYFIIVITNLF